MIPCKENKCLKLPICQNKREIYCNLLYDYVSLNYASLNSFDDVDFPLLSAVNPEEPIDLYQSFEEWERSVYEEDTL